MLQELIYRIPLPQIESDKITVLGYYAYQIQIYIIKLRQLFSAGTLNNATSKTFYSTANEQIFYYFQIYVWQIRVFALHWSHTHHSAAHK